MTNTTLDYSILTDLEVGTEEYGIARLKMILDFANETFVDMLHLAALGFDQGEVGTNYISIRTLSRVMYGQLQEQDEEIASIWGQSWKHIACSEHFIKNLLESWKHIIFVNVDGAEESGENADITFGLDLEAFNIACKMYNAIK